MGRLYSGWLPLRLHLGPNKVWPISTGGWPYSFAGYCPTLVETKLYGHSQGLTFASVLLACAISLTCSNCSWSLTVSDEVEPPTSTPKLTAWMPSWSVGGGKTSLLPASTSMTLVPPWSNWQYQPLRPASFLNFESVSFLRLIAAQKDKSNWAEMWSFFFFVLLLTCLVGLVVPLFPFAVFFLKLLLLVVLLREGPVVLLWSL